MDGWGERNRGRERGSEPNEGRQGRKEGKERKGEMIRVRKWEHFSILNCGLKMLLFSGFSEAQN